MLVSLLILLYCKSIIIGTDLTRCHTPSTTSSTLLETWVQIMFRSLSKYTKHHCTPFDVSQKHTQSTVLPSKLANAATCKAYGGKQLHPLRNFQLNNDLQ